MTGLPFYSHFVSFVTKTQQVASQRRAPPGCFVVNSRLSGSLLTRTSISEGGGGARSFSTEGFKLYRFER